MAAVSIKNYTVEEYFAIDCENDRGEKYEYYYGEIFAMAGGTMEHNKISRNIDKVLDSQTGCNIFTLDMRLQIENRNDYTYPDVMLVCGEFAKGTTIATNPVLIVEVISESTEHYDRTSKFTRYQKIQSLKYYLLVSQNEVFVELYTRNGGKQWLYESFNNMNDKVLLPDLSITLPLSDIYKKIKF